MKIRSSNILIYILVVVFPTLIACIYYLNDAIKQNDQERIERTSWIASLHQENWDEFISETVTTLEMLSLTAKTSITSPEKMAPLLQSTHLMEPRYGGIYLLDSKGMVIAGSNHLLQDADLSSKEYILEVNRTKDMIISDHQETLTNGQRVIGIGKPVLNEEGIIKSIIVAHLRIDYFQNIIRMLTPEATLSVKNSEGSAIMNINMDGTEISNENSISIPLERLPWSIQVEVPARDLKEISWKAIGFILQFLFICHIFFLFIKYLKLKKQTKLEKKENEVQKLELVGTLAASTAHEIRNPLTGIKGLVQLLSEKHTGSEDQYYFTVINDEISRINEIVSEFLILGKPTAQKTEVLDLRNIFTSIEPLIRSEANLNNVDYQSSIPSEQILVDCTKDQMKQVILNITKNAFESMDQGGRLNIKLLQLPNKCQIKITDTGSGISDNEIEKIFQPFYTSKDMGTGLGLVVCRRILQSFGGEIYISSEENKGTQVDIFLPYHQN